MTENQCVVVWVLFQSGGGGGGAVICTHRPLSPRACHPEPVLTACTKPEVPCHPPCWREVTLLRPLLCSPRQGRPSWERPEQKQGAEARGCSRDGQAELSTWLPGTTRCGTPRPPCQPLPSAHIQALPAQGLRSSRLLLLHREYSEDQRASRWPHVGAGPWEELGRMVPRPNSEPTRGPGNPQQGVKRTGQTRWPRRLGRGTASRRARAVPWPQGSTAGCPCGWALDQEAGNRDRDVHLREGEGDPTGDPTLHLEARGNRRSSNGGGCLHVGPERLRRGHPSRDNPGHVAQEELRGRRRSSNSWESANCAQAGAAAQTEGSSEGQVAFRATAACPVPVSPAAELVTSCLDHSV